MSDKVGTSGGLSTVNLVGPSVRSDSAMATRSFDARFYQRFYMNPRTRVTSREEMARRAGMVAALVKQLELPVKRILDAGCGLGW